MTNEQITKALSRTHAGYIIDTVLDNGDVLVRRGKTMTKVSASQLQKLSSQVDYLSGNNSTQALKDSMGELELEGLDASIQQENPFYNRNNNQQSTFGNPNVGQPSGLPSDNEPSQRYRVETDSRKYNKDNGMFQGLPSERK